MEYMTKPIGLQLDLFKIVAQAAAGVAWYLGEVSWLVPVLVACYYWQWRWVYMNQAMKQEILEQQRMLAAEQAWVRPTSNSTPLRSN